MGENTVKTLYLLFFLLPLSIVLECQISAAPELPETGITAGFLYRASRKLITSFLPHAITWEGYFSSNTLYFMFISLSIFQVTNKKILEIHRIEQICVSLSRIFWFASPHFLSTNVPTNKAVLCTWPGEILQSGYLFGNYFDSMFQQTKLKSS